MKHTYTIKFSGTAVVDADSESEAMEQVDLGQVELEVIDTEPLVRERDEMEER
jgi:hypothetical protein